MISAAWSETQPIPVSHSSRDNPLRPFSFPTQVCSVYLLLDCFLNCITIDHMTNGGMTNWEIILLTYCFHRERERNVLFNDALNTFYLRLYGVRHMVKDHSDSEKGNPLPPYRLLLSINSKGSFICTIPQTG